MRFILALTALAGIALFLSSRQRRDQLQQTVQDAPSGDVQQQAGTAASTIANAARSASGTIVERAQQVAADAQQAVSDAAPKVQQAADKATTAAQQAVSDATSRVQQAASDATSRVQQAASNATSGSRQTETTSAPQTQQATDGAENASQNTSAVETDVNTPPPSVRDMVRTEMADVVEQVDTLRAQSELPVDPAENSPQAAGISGVMDTSILDRRIEAESRGEPTVTGSAPVPPTAAGTGTAASTAGSSRAPTIPNSSETPTTGMDHTVIDRASEVEKRTSGNYIGNTSTRVFHAATAPNLPGEKHRVYFESEEEALAAGFRPAEH